MGRGILYLDSSALVKMVVPEAESSALLRSLQSWTVRVTSELARVEVVRAVRRAAKDDAVEVVERRAEAVLAGLHLLQMDDEILERAGRLEPRTLRAGDAIHLASALSLGADLGAMAIYDAALARAAQASGVEVVAPG
jgi:uncharacterized protein